MFNLATIRNAGCRQVTAINLDGTFDIGYWHPDIFFRNELLTWHENNDYIISECLYVIVDGGFAYQRALVKPSFKH